MLRKIQCKMCGKEFEGGPRAHYCADCRPERRKERDYKRGGVTAKRRIGDTDNCIICGKTYIVRASGARYCEKCSTALKKQRKKQPAQRHIGDTDICKNCGKSYIITSGKQKYCPECSKMIHDEAAKRIKKQQAKHNVGSIISCKYCGAEIIKQQASQQYCPQCKKIAVMEIDRKQGLEYYNKNRERINQKRRKERQEAKK